METASNELLIVVWDWFVMAAGWIALLLLAASALVVIEIVVRRILFDRTVMTALDDRIVRNAKDMDALITQGTAKGDVPHDGYDASL